MSVTPFSSSSVSAPPEVQRNTLCSCRPFVLALSSHKSRSCHIWRKTLDEVIDTGILLEPPPGAWELLAFCWGCRQDEELDKAARSLPFETLDVDDVEVEYLYGVTPMSRSASCSSSLARRPRPASTRFCPLVQSAALESTSASRRLMFACGGLDITRAEGSCAWDSVNVLGGDAGG